MPEGSDPNERTEQDKRLFTAIRDDNLEGVKEVLDAGANPNAIEGHHHTALSRAVVTDNSKIAGHLLDRGADPNARSGSGETPLHYGCLASPQSPGADAYGRSEPQCSRPDRPDPAAPGRHQRAVPGNHTAVASGRCGPERPHGVGQNAVARGDRAPRS